MKHLVLATAAAALAACSTTPPDQPALQQVSLRFAAEVNGQPFACGKSYTNIGTTQSTITPNDYRLYVSDIKLLKSDGSSTALTLTQDGKWQHQGVALLDFENGVGPCRNGTAQTNDVVTGTLAQATYSGVEFTIGVPFELNHGDPTTASSPLNSTAMFWNWQGGYKFIKFDTTTTGVNASKPASGALGPVTGYSVHIGSTLCKATSLTSAPSACANSNRVLVRFDRFDVAKGTVVVDIGAILANANVDVNAPKTAAGCMSSPDDADCPPIMAALGLAAHAPQRLMRVR